MPDRPARLLLARSLGDELAEALTWPGLECVESANDIEQALRRIESLSPDVIVWDGALPGVQGNAAAVSLHEAGQCPIVLVLDADRQPSGDGVFDPAVFAVLHRPLRGVCLADVVTLAWLRYVDQRRLALQVEMLERELTDRKVIERAKGILMTKLSLSEPEAMRHLQKKARDARRPMADLARSLIDAQDLVDESPR